MATLLPRDYWDYTIIDLFRGIVAGLGEQNGDKSLDLPGLSDCFVTRSGRAGIVTALKALELPPNSNVGVPLYCCPVVFEAITIAGLKPRFIDVDPSTFCMAPDDLASKRSEIQAAIAVHMFGNMCDMPGLRAAAGERPLIEDCAQAIGSKLQGRAAGTFGNVGVFSFRSGKYISAGEGGALYTQDGELRSRISRILSEQRRTGKTDELKHSAVVYLKSILRRRPLYGLVGHALWTRHNTKGESVPSAKPGNSGARRSDLALTRNKLKYLDDAIEGQRRNAEYFLRTLAIKREMLCVEPSDAYYNRLQFPITFSSTEARNLISEHLLAAKIDSTKYLDDVLRAATESYGYGGDCPTAESLSKRVLVIPSYYSLTTGEVERIGRCLNGGWEKVSARKASNRAENGETVGKAIQPA